MEKREYIDREFFAINNLKTFVKIKANSFGIDKFLLAFVEFDESNKMKTHIDIYLNIDDGLLLANDILTGRIVQLVEKSKKKANEEKKQFADSVWTVLGGTSKDGEIIARKLDIFPGNKQPIVLTAIQGKGQKTSEGLIHLTGKPDITIRVACDYPSIKKMALMMKAEYEGYLSGGYAKGMFISDKI